MGAPALRRPAATSAFVERALGVLAAESPAAYHRLADQLRPAPAGLEVDGESFSIDVRGDRLRVVRGPPHGPGGRVRAGGEVILDLIDGRTEVLEAVVGGRLDVRGDVEAVLRLARGLGAFVEGAVRAPGLRELLDEYRAAVRDD